MEGPQLTLDERLAERRGRIQKRLDAERGTTSDPAADGKKLDANRLGEERAQKARKAMASTHSEAVNAVSLFNVKANTMEEERREKNEVFTDSRRQKRAEEVADCEVRHGALSMQFEALYRHKVPHELHAAMEEQKKNCQELLGIKSKLVDELQMQLEDAEDSYVGLLRRNGADVKDLVMAMKNKSQEYQDHYSSELCEVEKAYMEERKNLLDQYSQDIQQLVKTRRTKETDYRKRREAKIMEAQMKLDNKYEESYEEFNKLKSEHLDEIHALRQEREKCKPDFMLNAERLSYNLQVLRERVKENKSAQNQYKRKLARLQNTLSTLVARHQESERKFQRANKDLTSQLHRVDVQYKDLQAKFQLFEKADKEKYRQLWNMHDQKCRHLVHRSLQADRVVFEDILSMPWSPPEMAFWPEEQEDMDGVDEEEQDDEVPEELELSEPAAMLFQILKSQATFLVDDNVRAAIAKIEGTTEEQAAVEGILTTLHISKKEDVEDLLEYFMVESDDESVALINPQEAIRALNAYLEERNASSKKAKDSAESQSPLRNKTKVKARQRERRLAAERNYWKQLSLCVPEDHLQVWRALEKGLEQYLAQLQLRRGLISDTDKLRVQNSELRGLLMQYQQTTGRMLM